jgi:hypothetical protein
LNGKRPMTRSQKPRSFWSQDSYKFKFGQIPSIPVCRNSSLAFRLQLDFLSETWTEGRAGLDTIKWPWQSRTHSRTLYTIKILLFTQRA